MYKANVKNYYPQFPLVGYLRTRVDMALVIAFAQTLVGKYPKEVVRTALAEFKEESGNGNHGVNNNYAGIQADCGVWKGLDLSHCIGTMVEVDGAGDSRRFLCFDDKGWQVCLDFLCYKMQQRNVYIGATGISNADDLAMAYELHWVQNAKENTLTNRNDFKSLYYSAVKAVA